MRFNQTEIIEDMEGIIRKSGGAWGEWCVGAAKDTHAPFFQRHLAEDLGDGLAYREGFTSNTADAVAAHLVNARGLSLDLASAPEPGRLVFVYHKTPTAALHGPQSLQESPPHPSRPGW
jgi:hypothetical protein